MVGLRRGHQAPSGGKDDRLLFEEHLLQDVALEPAVVVLAVQREDLGEAQIRRFFNAPIELDERASKPPCQAASHGRLAGASKSEEGDDSRLWGCPGGRKERGRRRVQRRSNVSQPAHRDVASAALELNQEPTGHPGFTRHVP